jgi:hypothetical protein
MKIQASNAMENGLTSQLTPTVVAMPRQCCPTSRGYRQVDLCDGRLAEHMKDPWHELAEDHAGDDAERDPAGQEALEDTHTGLWC